MIKNFNQKFVEICDKLMPGKLKYFDITKIDEAKKWISEV